MTAAPVWTPDPVVAARSALTAFTAQVERDHHVEVRAYRDLWRWSVEHLDDFWIAIWRFFDVVGEPPPGAALARAGMPGAVWFPEAQLNYATQVFRNREPDDVAIVEVTEVGQPTEISWAELERQVAAMAAGLGELGVGVGDSVAGYLPNCAAAVVAFLATASIGAVWSCCGPDYGAPAASDRLAQLKPKVLVCADGYLFAGNTHDRRDAARTLAQLLPTVTSVVHVSHLGLPSFDFDLPVLDYASLLAEATAPLTPLPVPFDHPLWVLYSSGTTGLPKGIVHGHGGVVLEHLKIVGLHFDLGPGDRLFWYTTTNWMMWNFAIAALLVGASTVTYDGSPAQPEPDRFWRVAAQARATVVGASPAYLQACERNGCRPARSHDLRSVRLIGCTGAPVPASCHYWVRKQFGPAVPLQSSSGGTDIVSGLAGGTPTVPVWAGELSCPNLGVALDAFDEAGRPVRDAVGELVVSAPMPTMPLRFVGDPEGNRYRDTYFATFPGVWRHGDWVTMTERGTVVIHGRSDATLNRNGVRLGSAEIYAIVEAVPGVREALVVGVDLAHGRYWMPLFVVLDEGLKLDDALCLAINERLQRGASPRHVPDEIIAVPAIPHTRTGKKLEVPVKRILAGDDPATAVAANALDDVRALAPFIKLAEHKLSERPVAPQRPGRGRACRRQ